MPRCLKRIVSARICKGNELISVGLNDISNEVTECPRMNMKTGEGYHLCKDVCGQRDHAELDALKNAGNQDLTGCILYLSGHSYVCDSCKEALKARGVKWLIL